MAVKTVGPWGRAGASARAAPFPGAAGVPLPRHRAHLLAPRRRKVTVRSRRCGGCCFVPLSADAAVPHAADAGRTHARPARSASAVRAPAPRWYLKVTWWPLLGPCPQISSSPGAWSSA